MRRTSAAVPVLALVLCALPAAPAHAVAAGVIQGIFIMPNSGPTGANGSFEGTATGPDGTQVLISAPATAEFSYLKTCIEVILDGTLHVNGKDYAFHLQSVGAVALVTFSTGGVAVATVAPLSVPCGGPVDALVVMTGVFSL